MTEWHPNWADVYRGCVWHPDGDNDLIAVTRETLRLSKSAIRRQQEIEAYHNYEAAEREIVTALSPPTTTGDREMSDDRPCTCHPDDKPPVPCERQYALTDCRTALRARIAGLREAAEIVRALFPDGALSVFVQGKASGCHAARSAILARIAELEQKS